MEITEEFTEGDDGQIRMLKRKVVSKPVPPDVSAVKLLYEINDDSQKSISSMSDDELEKEKIRLLKLLESLEKNN